MVRWYCLVLLTRLWKCGEHMMVHWSPRCKDTLPLLRKPHFHVRSDVSQVRCCCFSPDGSLVLSGSWDNTLKVWRTRDGSLVNTLQGHTKDVTKTTLSCSFWCFTGFLLLFFTWWFVGVVWFCWPHSTTISISHHCTTYTCTKFNSLSIFTFT